MLLIGAPYTYIYELIVLCLYNFNNFFSLKVQYMLVIVNNGLESLDLIKFCILLLLYKKTTFSLTFLSYKKRFSTEK